MHFTLAPHTTLGYSACITSFTTYGQRKMSSLQREEYSEIQGALPKCFPFPVAKTKPQRAEVIHPRSHNESKPSPGLYLSTWGSF